MHQETATEFEQLTKARNDTRPDLVEEWQRMDRAPRRIGHDFFSVFRMDPKLGTCHTLLRCDRTNKYLM